VTFLFTDIEGHTRLWDHYPEATTAALAKHDHVVRSAIEAHGGYVFTTAGDSFSAAFASTADAVAAAVAAQRALGAVDWPDGVVFRVRMGLHTGEALDERDGDYFGPAVIRAGRIMSLAHGGQILLSQATALLLDGSSVQTVPVATLELQGLAGTETVHQVVAEGLQERFAPIPTESARTNLPAERDELIGRSEELSKLVGLLTQRRLVTLTGPGGIGKTALASTAGRQLLSRFTDGVWLIDLAAVSTDAEVGSAIATTLGFQRASGGSLGLVAELVGRLDALLLLDNCEHVIDAASRFADELLRHEAGSILATSRERLDVHGEYTIRLGPLDLSDSDGDAVRLFVGRAAYRSAVMDSADLDLALMICRRLDGSPLAIELAASRTATLTLEDIHSRLDDRFQLLRRRRDPDQRHRTLLDTLEWSYDLLPPGQQQVLDRLSVFNAAFGYGDADRICADLDIDVLDALDALGEASLIEPAGTGRLRLLETTRAFGRRHIAQSDGSSDLHDRHTSLVMERITAIGAGLRGPDERRWWEELQKCMPELRAVIQRCVDEGDPSPGSRIIAELVEFTFVGILPEIGHWANTVGSIHGASREPLYPAVVTAAAYGAVNDLDLQRAAGWLDVPVDLTAPTPFAVKSAYLNILAGSDSVRARFMEASHAYQVIADEAEAVGDQRLAAFYLASVGFQLSLARRPDLAEPHARRALKLAQADRHPSTVSWCHYQLAIAMDPHTTSGSEVRPGDASEAERHFESCVEAAKGAAPSSIASVAAVRLALLRARRGALAGIADTCRSATEQCFRTGADMYYWNLIIVVAQVLVELGDSETALRLAGAFSSQPLAGWSIVGDWFDEVLKTTSVVIGAKTSEELINDGTHMSARETLGLIQATTSTVAALGPTTR
jgi:predicted ATPase/class 3 adenylate cyclase